MQCARWTHRFIKGIETSASQRGGYIGEAPAPTGAQGINVGDGFHDYLLAGFVSCNHNNIIPRGRVVTGAHLKLRASDVFGVNPMVASGQVKLRVDMVRAP